MPYLGILSLFSACIFTALALVAGIRGRKFEKHARQATTASVVAVCCATLFLILCFVSNDFRVAYVANNSSRSLPLIYKISALWAGQSGSLLLWLLIISLYAVAVQRSTSLQKLGLDVRANIVVNLVRLVFIVLLLFVTPPFQMLEEPPSNGFGLNPMLQSIGMVIHPPLLFLGFSGFLIPFSLAVVSLWEKDESMDWLKAARPWLLVAWGFLTSGIVTGGRWAYTELGWGGYWAWDPVENASLLPWLTGTALINTLTTSGGNIKLWSYSLSTLTFALTIFGTFLTRSGILDSVHAFSGGILGPIFLGMLLIIIAFSLYLGWTRRDLLRQRDRFERTGEISLGFVAQLGNLVWLVIFLIVLLATMFPIISRVLLGREIVLDEGFYNQMTVPLFLLNFFLLGLTPALPRDGVSWLVLVKKIWFHLVLGLALGLFTHFAYGGGTWVCLAVGIASFGISTHLRAMRQARGNLIQIGALIMLIGIAVSSTFGDEIFLAVQPGEKFSLGNYEIQYSGLSTRYGMEHYVVNATLTVTEGAKEIGELTSEKTFWEQRRQPSTSIGILSTFKEDLYFNLAGWEGQTAQVHVQRFPLVSWIWFGSRLLYLGVVLEVFRLGLGAGVSRRVKAWSNKTFSK